MTGPGPRHVVIVGGGASGTLAAVHLLRTGQAGLRVTVAEPREALGRGVAFGTPDPWHRLNVPAITMSGLEDEPDHFRAFADVPADAYPSRGVFGAYLGSLLDGARQASPAVLEHVRDRAVAITDAGRTEARLDVSLATGSRIAADAVVLATGNELPRLPAFCAAVVAVGDGRFVADPWAEGSLDAIGRGDAVGIIGTGHTAMDLAATLVRRRGVATVIALSRHGELPHAHEEPWRPRPAEPAFTVEAFAAWPDKPAEVRRRLGAHPLGWRQAIDSLRPQAREMWLAMSDAERADFLAGHRREWEICRSRLAPQVSRDVEAWIADGTLDVRAVGIHAVVPDPAGILVETSDGRLRVDHLLLATGPDESPSANPLLASLVRDGLAVPGSQDLGIDVDPYGFRVRDAGGSTTRPLYALGPIIRGSVWESIAIPEIRRAAATIAADATAD